MENEQIQPRELTYIQFGCIIFAYVRSPEPGAGKNLKERWDELREKTRLLRLKCQQIQQDWIILARRIEGLDERAEDVLARAQRAVRKD